MLEAMILALTDKRGPILTLADAYMILLFAGWKPLEVATYGKDAYESCELFHKLHVDKPRVKT